MIITERELRPKLFLVMPDEPARPTTYAEKHIRRIQAVLDTKGISKQRRQELQMAIVKLTKKGSGI